MVRIWSSQDHDLAWLHFEKKKKRKRNSPEGLEPVPQDFKNKFPTSTLAPIINMLKFCALYSERKKMKTGKKNNFFS